MKFMDVPLKFMDVPLDPPVSQLTFDWLCRFFDGPEDAVE